MAMLAQFVAEWTVLSLTAADAEREDQAEHQWSFRWPWRRRAGRTVDAAPPPVSR